MYCDKYKDQILTKAMKRHYVFISTGWSISVLSGSMIAMSRVLGFYFTFKFKLMMLETNPVDLL